ncbi:MAG TPA: tetratricopeptide repeat protein, partial [Micromonosporaceae bacterium]|nr:tetratricopeptide repeat protein [Micromonosporaceae bacterium]
GRTDVAFDLAGCLEKYFDIRGRYHDWRATNELVAHACAERGDRLGHAVMRRGLVDVLTWHSDEPGGDAMARLHADAAELERAFADLGEPRGQADALVTRSWGLTARGRYAEAVDAARRSLELATATDHAGGRARAHVALAVAHGEHRELAPALEHLQRALEVAGTLDNPRYEATVLQFLGIAYCRAGEADAGLRVVERSLATFRRYGDGYAEALSLLTQARLYGLSGDPRARQAAGAALEIARDYDMGHHVADALGVLGELALAEGDGERAVAHLSESVALWRARGWPSFLATALRALGRAHAAHQPGADPAVAREKARAAWTEARGIAEALGDDTTRAELDALLAGLPAASG